MHRGWTKDWRKKLDHPLYSHPLVWHYFGFCVTMANIEDKLWMAGDQLITVKRGSFVTSFQKSSKATGLSFQNIRTAQKKLQLLEMISQKSTNKFTVITVCNYETYQCAESGGQQTTNKRLTNDQQTTNKRLTTTKEAKELKERIRKEKNNSNSVPEVSAELEKNFELFWKEYPNEGGSKKGKGTAKDWFISNLTLEESEKVITAARNYKADGVKPRNVLIFLRGKVRKSEQDWDWKDWIEAEKGGSSAGNNGHLSQPSNYGQRRFGTTAEVDLDEPPGV